MNPVLRRYLVDIGPPTLCYFVSVAVAMLLAKRIEPGFLRMLACLLPLPSVIWLAWAEIRRLGRRDELRRRIEVEAITVAFALSFGVIVTLTFLELGNAMTIPLPFATAGVLMSACWVIAHIIVRSRYRYWCVLSDKGFDKP